ncbi:rho GTPase-activating protein 100F-like isoform X2 [Artemia franciscana]|uniref:rho GTPase-activating protein 100F-like isoform X2 n=1 Tax=Artemia franciscana TaxID=6661 RepID=UPI0032DB2FC5
MVSALSCKTGCLSWCSIKKRRMLCCGGKKENEQGSDMGASPRRQQMETAKEPQQSFQASTTQNIPGSVSMQRREVPMVLQSDFRKVSGISTEIFRQIETIENDTNDMATQAAIEAVERRGEMIVRQLDTRQMGVVVAERARTFLSLQDHDHVVTFVEIVKRPGQTLGLYIREGNGFDKNDGVFISRIAIESAVYNSGCLRVGDEILAVNLVDVTRMGLDDVVIIMSIPKRLVLTIRQRRKSLNFATPPMQRIENKPPPVVVMKRNFQEEERYDPRNENYQLFRNLESDVRTLDRLNQRGEMSYQNRFNTVGGKPQRSDVCEHYAENYREREVVTQQPKTQIVQRFPTDAPSQVARTSERLSKPVQLQFDEQKSGGQNNPVLDSALNKLVETQRGHSSLSTSQQKLFSDGEFYEYNMAKGVPTRQSFRSSTTGRIQPPPRLSAARGRTTSLDYASDTEVVARGQMYHTLRPRMISQYSASKEAQYSTGPSSWSASMRRQNQPLPDSVSYQLRTGSLPRDTTNKIRDWEHGRDKGRRDLIAENDGTLSAPELPAGILNKGIFTSDEYRAWLQRAPSTSAIYESLRNHDRDAYCQTRAVKSTYSAENLGDKGLEGQSYYAFRRDFVHEDTLAPPMATLTRTSSQIQRSVTAMDGKEKLIEIDPADFMKYRGEKAYPPLSPGTVGPFVPPPTTAPYTGGDESLSGILWIHLLGGRNLKSTGGCRREPLRDLYCVLECDRIHKARTVIRTGDIHFDWDETFDLDLVNNKELDFLVYSWDPKLRHRLCFKGSVILVPLLKDTAIQQLALRLEPRGTLYLKLQYTEPRLAFRRVPANRQIHSAIFGADLEGVVVKEASSVGVPILVQRCIEEVERRGMDIVGLYRLCGSATKKRILRDAFEKNTRTVDLSPDNVPDINVITGVLKEYLRELPDPLIPRCLYQMLVDALSVCMPDDPDGNAKLIFSILECMPKACKSTLFLLLDHLCLVAAQADRNKMTPQNLAGCFGPILILSSDGPVDSLARLDFQRPISVLNYLLHIWPSRSDSSGSGSSGSSSQPESVRRAPVSGTSRSFTSKPRDPPWDSDVQRNRRQDTSNFQHQRSIKR